ncbi:hypothetical protein V2J09_002531 [Rumex salicifolius]
MDSVCKELQEVKLELGKLKDEYRIKTEVLEHLRKANDDQAVRYQEVKLQMEKLTHELSTKEGDIAESRHLYEDVKCRLQETESSLKHASSINEKLRIDSGEKVQRLEEENRKLISGLNEATLNTSVLERQLCASREEVAGLKVLVLDSQKKCLEAEQKIELKKELSSRDDAIVKLEEKCMDVQDRLKWKTEHFEHLKEAHKLLQEHLQSSKQEWASEKTTLLQEISSLQINLDTQARLNENLQSELRMCNQALANEESRRRTLEIQLSESKVCFENVLGEFNEAKSNIENLSMERDEKVADLRNALSMKNAHVKEMEYRISHLEQENKELLHSVKELQEAQIGRKKPDSSFIRLRNKFRDLEQTHNCCSMILEEREAEWSKKMESMIGQVTRCEIDLKTKTEEINQLKLQVETCQSSVDISAEEISILLMVLKSAYSEVHSEMLDLKLESDTQKEEVVMQETESESQLKAQLRLEQAGEEIESLSKKLEALKIVENKNTVLEDELDKCRKMLDESAVSQIRLKEHVALMEASTKQMKNEVVGLEKEKTEVERKLKTREEHVALTEASTKQMKNEVVCLQKAKTQLERELKTREEHVELMEASSKQMMNEVVGLQKEKTELERELKTREEHVALMEVSGKQMTNEVFGFQKEKTELERELKTREEHVALMEASTKQMMNELFGLQKEKTELERELKTREEHVALMEASGKQMRNEVVGLQKEKTELERELKTREEHVALMEASTKQMMNEVVGLRKEKTQLERESKTREEHVALMEASTKQIRNEVVGLQKEKSQLEKELKTRELLARSDVEKLKQEMEKLYTDVSISSSSETFEMLTKNGALREALKNAEHLITTEAQERNHSVSVLEKEISDMRAELLHCEESLLYSQTRVKELEALLEHKALEMDTLKGDLGKVQGKYKKAEKELELTKQARTEDIRKLSSERDYLVACIEGVYKQIGGFQEEDAKLIAMLDKMQGNCDEDGKKLTESIVNGSEVGDRMKDDNFSNKGKTKENLGRKVCPLRELN